MGRDDTGQVPGTAVAQTSTATAPKTAVPK
jgi:hypothetical protein